MREWNDIHQQLNALVTETGVAQGKFGGVAPRLENAGHKIHQPRERDARRQSNRGKRLENPKGRR
jgi:hypothetical protein